MSEELKTARMTVAELARQVEVERSSSSNRTRAADSQGSDLKAALAAAEKRHAAEVSAVKAQLRTSEVQCQQAMLDLQAANKLNSELSEQVSVFESVLAEKDAEVAEVSQQLHLARTLVTNLSEQTEVAVNLELVLPLMLLAASVVQANPCVFVRCERVKGPRPWRRSCKRRWAPNRRLKPTSRRCRRCLLGYETLRSLSPRKSAKCPCCRQESAPIFPAQ